MNEEMAKLIERLFTNIEARTYEKGKLLSCLELIIANKHLLDDESFIKEVKQVISECY